MDHILPYLVWGSVWAATIVFGFMMILYLFLVLMGDKELKDLRKESDKVMKEYREVEAEEKLRRKGGSRPPESSHESV